MKGKKKPANPTRAARPELDLGEAERVLAFMAKHGLEEFEYSRGDLHIRLKKPAVNSNSPGPRAIAVPEAAVASSDPSAGARKTPAAPDEAAAEASRSEDLHIVQSPIVGTFYSAPSPGAQLFVKVGDAVEPGQVLCIIEAMKLMNEIESDVGGEVVRIFAENGQPVEYGEPLFAIRPTPKK